MKLRVLALALLVIALPCTSRAIVTALVTVQAEGLNILGANQPISLTVTLVDPNATGCVRVPGGGLLPIQRASTVTPGATATVGPIYGNDAIADCFGNLNTTYYLVQVFPVINGTIAFTPAFSDRYQFGGSGTIDLINAVPLTPSYVNTPGGLLVTGNLTAANPCNIGGAMYVGGGCTFWSGSDIGAQINSAYTACPSYGCTIYILPPSGSCYSWTTAINFSTVGKLVNLVGIAPAGVASGTQDTGACLNWQSSSGTAATIDWQPTSGGGPPGGGITNVTFWDNSCTTNGGCGNTANGLSIGPVNGGCMGCTFSKVKWRGWGSGVIFQANGAVLEFTQRFDNFVFQNNTIGVNSAQASEGWNFDTGLFIQNGTGFSQNATNTQIKFDEVHWDGNTAAGFTGSGCSGGIFTFVANHFENNGPTTTHYVSCGGQGDLLFEGGLAVDDKGSSNTDFWFNAGNMTGNLKIASVGETATNVFVSSMLCMNISNGSTGILTGVANGLNCGGTFKNSATNGVLFASGTQPTISSGFGTGPSIASNGTFAITVNVGTGGAASSGVIGMPTAATAWVCTVNNQTAAAANRASNTRQTASTSTSVTIQNQTTSTGAALAWTASDIVVLSCWGT